MRRRPQPNPRRGLLRAGVVVVVLTAILVAVILVISSLTAPKANAPSVPATIPISTPPRVTPRPTVRATAPARKTPKPAATPSKTAKKDVALGSLSLAETRPSRLSGRAAGPAPAAAPFTFYFAGGGDAYRGVNLFARLGGRVRLVGRADPYARPVWSPDHQQLFYLRVRHTHRYPGAHWSLLQYDIATGRTHPIAGATALGLSPLGWRAGRVLYAVANASDTSLYSVAGARSTFLSILVPQPISEPFLSPAGDSVAFFTPASCSYCTLSLFNLTNLTTWNGPSGAPSELDVAWNWDSSTLVTALGHDIAAIDVSSHSLQWYGWPRGLPTIWGHSMVASISPTSLRLTDTVTGLTYRAPQAGSA